MSNFREQLVELVTKYPDYPIYVSADHHGDEEACGVGIYYKIDDDDEDTLYDIEDIEDAVEDYIERTDVGPNVFPVIRIY